LTSFAIACDNVNVREKRDPPFGFCRETMGMTEKHAPHMKFLHPGCITVFSLGVDGGKDINFCSEHNRVGLVNVGNKWCSR